MASLRSLILDEQDATAATDPDDQKAFVQARRGTLDCLRSHGTKLVNINSVAEDIAIEWIGDPELCAIPCPKPPCEHMWLEVSLPGRVRFGALANNTEITDQYDLEPHYQLLRGVELDRLRAKRPAAWVEVLAWREANGYANFLGVFDYWLDAEGEFQAGLYSPFKEPGYDDKARIAMLYNTAVLVMHSFARFNCDNVKLVPMAASAPGVRNGSKRPPSSVWHEIVVRRVTSASRRGDSAPDGEKRELRFHSVRGHYADYRKGKGLFGRYRVRLWIAEHRKGNPDLGTVQSSYKVE